MGGYYNRRSRDWEPKPWSSPRKIIQEARRVEMPRVPTDFLGFPKQGISTGLLEAFPEPAAPVANGAQREWQECSCC